MNKRQAKKIIQRGISSHKRLYTLNQIKLARRTIDKKQKIIVFHTPRAMILSGI